MRTIATVTKKKADCVAEFNQRLGLAIADLPPDQQGEIINVILSGSHGEDLEDLLVSAKNAGSPFVPARFGAEQAAAIQKREAESKRAALRMAGSEEIRNFLAEDPEIKKMKAEVDAAKKRAKLAEVRHASVLAEARLRQQAQGAAAMTPGRGSVPTPAQGMRQAPSAAPGSSGGSNG